jgi:hypothetical protein
MESLCRGARTTQLPQSLLRVKVIGAEIPGDEIVPDVLGRCQILTDGIVFVPNFPFVPGVRYLASFDSREFGYGESSEVLTMEFSLPKSIFPKSAEVSHVFPSSALLPENLLRLYICFSNSMQRGQVKEHVALLGPDGEPAQDVLYRSPVELWDRSMRRLTILLDPGRLKRGVGPNRELGPPLKAGLDYTLAVGSGMVDSTGNRLRLGSYKYFRVGEPVREGIAIKDWRVLTPATESVEPLVLEFPKPLDWAMLWHTITITSESGCPINGRIIIDEGEKRWNFTPFSPWAAGAYHVRVAPSLEDVCGNNLEEPFDAPFRTALKPVFGRANGLVPFRLD